MADNIIQILVESINRTKEGFSAAKKDAETAGDEAGQGFMAKFGSWLVGGQTKNGGGGIGGILKTAFSMGPVGIGGLAAVIAAAAVELDGLATAAVAAGLGVASVGILALPTFDKIKNAYTGITTAQAAYNKAVEKEQLQPSKTNATAVNNAKVALEMAQKAAGPGISGAVGGVQQLQGAFSKLSTAFQPQALKIFNDALGIANQLLPYVGKFANAAAPAIESLMKSLSKEISSKGFSDFMNQLLKVTPGAITAIGKGIGEVAGAFGKLFTIMSAHDVVHAVNIAFGILAGIIKGVAFAIKGSMVIWDQLSSHVAAFAKAAARDLANWAQVFDNIVGNVNNWFNVTLPTAIATGIHWFQQLPGKILSAIGNLGGLLVGVGKAIIGGLISGIESALGPLGSVLHSVTSFISSHKGPLDADAQLLVPHGQAIMGGLMRGIGSRVPALGAQLGGITGMIGGYGAAGAGHGGPAVIIQVAGSGNTTFDALMTQWLRKNTRILGGGSVQTAFGKAGM